MIKILKWLSVIITVMAAITISFRLTNITTSYVIFFIGHIIMVYSMIKTRDWSLLTMNMMWVLLDIIGFINWYQN